MNRFLFNPTRRPNEFSDRLKQRGFSLYELIVTSSIASILGIAAIGTFHVVQDTVMTSRVNQIMSELNLTRSEAINRGAAVTLCISEDGATCTNNPPWQVGWIIFVDENGNHRRDVEETIIRVSQKSTDQIAIRYGGERQSYSHLTYYPQGYARPNATFSFCDRRGSKNSKAVIINAVGRPRTYRPQGNENSFHCS